MPQFDATVWLPQIIWLTISFIVLYVLLSRFALPRIGDILEERDHKINDSLRRAELLREDAEAAMTAYEKTMVDARLRAQETLRAVRELAAAEAAERNAALSERLSAEVSSAEARIAAARDEAVAGVREMAAEIAQVAAERLGGIKVTKKAAGGAVADVLGGGR